MINLKQRLIVDYSSLKAVAKILSAGQNELILVFFSMAIIFEFFGEWNFGKVLKRIVVCFIVLVAFETLLRSSIDLSFGISDRLLDQCKNTEFCSHYLALKKGASTDATLWSETVHVVKNYSSFWLHSLVSLIFKVAFVFTIQIYSLVYAITSVMYPLICSIGILPSPGEKAFISLFQTLLWLFISPIVLSVVIVLLASVTEVGMGPNGEVGLEGVLHLMIISLFSLGSLFLSWLLCKGEGVAAFGAKMAQMGTSVLTMAGVGGMMNIGRGGGGALGNLGGMAAGHSRSKIKGLVSNKVSEGISNKGIEVGASEVANAKNNPINSPIIPKGSEAYRNLSRGEKLLHSVDSVINAKENSMAKQGMIRDFKKISSAGPSGVSGSHGSPKPFETKFRAADYKVNARKSMAPHLGKQFQNNVPSKYQRPNSNFQENRNGNGLRPRMPLNKQEAGNIGNSFSGNKTNGLKSKTPSASNNHSNNTNTRTR